LPCGKILNGSPSFFFSILIWFESLCHGQDSSWFRQMTSKEFAVVLFAMSKDKGQKRESTLAPNSCFQPTKSEKSFIFYHYE